MGGWCCSLLEKREKKMRQPGRQRTDTVRGRKIHIRPISNNMDLMKYEIHTLMLIKLNMPLSACRLTVKCC